MSWTYTNGDPAASNLNQVRFQIGDTLVNDQQLSDEEINYQLAQAGITGSSATLSNTILVSVKCCRRLAALYSRQVRKQVGKFRLEAETKYQHYMDLAKVLMQESGSWTPYAGGISVSDKENNADDTDWAKPFFSRDVMKEGEVDDSPVDQDQQLAV